MIYVLHGENQVGSRSRLQQIKEDFDKKGIESVFLDGKTANFEQIALTAKTNSLLGSERLVIVENFFSDKKREKNLAFDLEGIEGCSVIFWEEKELGKTLIGSMPKDWKLESFPIPQLVFKFLDNIIPGKPSQSLKILQQIYAQNEQIYAVVPLIAWHVRYLIWAKEESESLNIPLWRTSKLISQANKFDKNALYNFHTSLLNLDRDIKTGTSVLLPLSSLDLLLTKL